MKALFTSLLSIILYHMITPAYAGDSMWNFFIMDDENNIEKIHWQTQYDAAVHLYKVDSLTQSLLMAHESKILAVNQTEKTKSSILLYAIHFKANNFSKSLEFATQAIASAPNERLKNINYYNAGLALNKLEDLDSALKYFHLAYDYFSRTDDQSRAAANLNMIAITYYNLPDMDKARHYYNELLDYAQYTNQSKYIGNAYNNIGNSYIDSNKDSASKYLKLALEYQNERDIMQTYLNLAQVSDHPKPYLLAAKNSYTNKLDDAAYVKVLSQLMMSAQNKDSVYAYSQQLAAIAIARNDENNMIDDYTTALEMQIVEQQIAAMKQQREHDKFVKWVVKIVVLSLIVLALIGYILIKKIKSHIPETMNKKISLLEYEKDEYKNTLRQIKEALGTP